MFIQTIEGLREISAPQTAYTSYGSLRLYESHYQDYATLYGQQPGVRTCVEFLARNIAQLGLHWFRRVSETDRERLRDHPLAQLLTQPMPTDYKVTRYKLFEATVADIGIYHCAYWVKMGMAGGTPALLRMPPRYVTVYGDLYPESYEVSLSSGKKLLKPSEVVHFHGYSPESQTNGLSPLETLRRVLAEEYAMGDYREYYWANAARMAGVIERPKDAPEWSPAARDRFLTDWGQLYAGGPSSGKTAVLEEGMQWKQQAFSAQESEYLAGRKLTREECARAYHIPLPMVGILDHATFSNIKEQHKNLYQDSLGPWLAMLEEDLMLQLLPDFQDTKGVYCEFNIAEKLQGSFEDQTTSVQSAVGAPWMTANEARARFNMPSLPGNADRLAMPMNIMYEGEEAPEPEATPAPAEEPAPQAEAQSAGAVEEKARRRRKLDATMLRLRKRHVEKWHDTVSAYFRRQQASIMSRVPAKAARLGNIDEVWRDGARWDRELQDDLLALNVNTATTWAKRVLEMLEIEEEIDEAQMMNYLDENSRIAAEEINATTRDQLAKALTDDEDPRAAALHVFEVALGARAMEIATAKVTNAASFGSNEAARQGGLREKTWQVNSGNPRDAHAAVDGETVAIRELFSNGMRWPGDPAGGADNNAGCQCSVVFSR